MQNKKNKLIECILANLNRELESISLSAKAAHEAATHEESKAEDSHDTRGLEASYLAGAQQARIESLKKTISFFQFLEIRNFEPSDRVSLGACIELEREGKRFLYFLAAQGGGVSVSLDGQVISVITPQTPLFEALLDKQVGDIVEVEGAKFIREYEVISVG